MPIQNAIRRKEITDITPASTFDLSLKIPITPKIRDIGRHPNISNAPSDAIGLPHPGCKTVSKTNVPRAIANNVAEIFPNFICTAYPFGL
jgi:hypothetical protein